MEAIIIILFVSFFGLFCISEDKRYYGKCEKLDTEVDCSKVDVRECEFGLGCFANRNIKKNEVVERGVMMPLPNVDGNEHDHLFTWSENRKLWACGSGCLPFYNHSNEPNIAKVGNLQTNRMEIIALRDIAKGEEMRNRYMSSTWRACFQGKLI